MSQPTTSRSPRPDCLDPIPESPYAKDTRGDQEWRMGYVDGMERDPMWPGSPAAYRQGWWAGRKHSEQFGR